MLAPEVNDCDADFCNASSTASLCLSFLLTSSQTGERLKDHPLNVTSVAQLASGSIISNVLGDNTPAIRNTRGRPLWLRYHRDIDALSVSGGVPRGCLSLAIYGAHYRFTAAANGPDLSWPGHMLNICRDFFESPRPELEIFTLLHGEAHL